MVLIFLRYLQGMGFSVPSFFFYSSTRMLLAALTSLLLVLLLGPRCIKKLYEMKTGQSIRVEDCPLLAQLHEKKKETPTMGGVLILGSMLASLLLWMDWRCSFTWLLFLTTIWLGGMGACDDYLKLKHKNSKGMKPSRKFLGQVLLGVIIALYLLIPEVSDFLKDYLGIDPPMAISPSGERLSSSLYTTLYFIPFYKVGLGLSAIFAFFSIPFVISGFSNGVNLTDGLDGLAAGTVMLAATTLSLIAFLSSHQEISAYLHLLYLEKSGEIAIYLVSMGAAALGFLWYNGYPAQVFMGDTGSLALGGVLALSAVLLRRELLLGIVGGIFVAEAFSVIAQVGSWKLRRKRVFLCAPLHHHFEYKGWPETKVVMRFWIVGLLLAVIGLISVKIL